MSEQTIREKSQVIRNETNKYANTRERVADVLDDINDTKANKDASELSEENKVAWKEALGVGGGTAPNFQSVMNEGTYAKVQDFHIGIHHLYPNHFTIQRDEFHNSYSLSTYFNVSEKYQAGVRKSYIDGRFLNNVNMLYEISEEGHAFYTHYNSTSPQESYVMKIGVNSKVVINPAYHNADGDNAYTHRVVSKPDGTLGMVPMPIIKKVILKNDISITDELQEVEDLRFTLLEGKMYRIKIVFMYNGNYVGAFGFFYGEGLSDNVSINIYVIGRERVVFNSNTDSPTPIRKSNITNHIFNEEGFIKTTSNVPLKLLVKKFNPTNATLTIERGSYIEIEEIM